MFRKEELAASHDKFLGATVHRVDEGMDTGPILAQAAFPNYGLQAFDRVLRTYRFIQDVLMVQVFRDLVSSASTLPARVCGSILFSPGWMRIFYITFLPDMSYPDLRIIVLSPYCLLRPTTNRIYDMRMSDALAGHGAEVEIVYPYTYMRDNIRRAEIPKMYGTRFSVRERMHWTPLREHSPSWWRISWIMFAFSMTALRLRFFSGKRKQTLVFSRDPNLLLPILLLMKWLGSRPAIRTVFLLAEMKDRKLYKWVAKNSDFLPGRSFSDERRGSETG